MHNHHHHEDDTTLHQQQGFVIPSFRSPIVVHTASSSSRGCSSDWLTEGNAVWERCVHTVPTLLTDVALFDMTSGLGQLQRARLQVAHALEEYRPPHVDALDALQKALLSYAVLLQTCRKELESVLTAPPPPPTADSTTGSSSNVNHVPGSSTSKNNHEASLTSLDNESTVTSNTIAVLEELITDVLLLQWKDVVVRGTAAESESAGEAVTFVRPPVPLTDTTTPNASQSPPQSPQSQQQQQQQQPRPHHYRVLQLWMWLLHWEEWHVYWNISLVSMTMAMQLPKDSRPAWKQAGTHWQTAAAWMQYVRTELGFMVAAAAAFASASASQPPPQDQEKNKSSAQQQQQEQLLLSWESWMMAEAQRAAYQFVFVAPRPSPLMAAKIASGAVPLYAQAVAAFAHPACSGVLWTNSEVCKAWHMALSAVAEYHQATLHASKLPQQWPQAMARIQRANQLGRLASEVFNSLLAEYGMGFELETNTALAPPFLQELQTLIQTAWPKMRELHHDLSHSEHAPQPNSAAAASVETLTLPDIPPQNLVKIQAVPTVQTALTKVASSLSSENNSLPLFPRMNARAQRYRMDFAHQLHDLFQQTDQLAKKTTEQAKQALAQVDLPNSLIRYQEEMGVNGDGGGSSGDQEQQQESLAADASSAQPASPSQRAAHLWRRVERIQQGRSGGGETHAQQQGEMHSSSNNNIGLSELTQGLWELRDNADRAHDLVREIQRQMDENVALEQDFCKDNPLYEVKDVHDIQSSFLKSLNKYDQLLRAAASGDEVLFGRLEHLPTDPKFQFLSRLTAAQVARVVLGATQEHPEPKRPPNETTSNKDAQPQQPSAEMQETAERLSQGLHALSSLFQTRNQLVEQQLPNEMQMAIRDASEALWKASDDENEMERLILETQPSVNSILEEIRSNLKEQVNLMEEILRVNEGFQALLEQQEANRKPAVVAAAAPAAASTENNSSSSSTMGAAERTLVMLEDALEEMEQLTGHWQQGENFYQGVIPKLEKLQQQVSEVSTRLAIERYDFNDQQVKLAQEAKDAAMAKAMADRDNDEDNDENNNNSDGGHPNGSSLEHAHGASGGPSNGHDDAQQRQHDGEPGFASDHELHGPAITGDEQPQQRQRSRRQGSRPSSFVQEVRNDEEPSVQVDDEKVASLVAMEFDPEKVVAALEKYDNNVDQALNELLSG